MKNTTWGLFHHGLLKTENEIKVYFLMAAFGPLWPAKTPFGSLGIYECHLVATMALDRPK